MNEEQGHLKLADYERFAIARALNVSYGNVRKAARLLGIGKTTIYRKMKQYSLGKFQTAEQERRTDGHLIIESKFSGEGGVYFTRNSNETFDPMKVSILQGDLNAPTVHLTSEQTMVLAAWLVTHC